VNLSHAALTALQNQLAQSEAKNRSLQAVLDRLMLEGGKDHDEDSGGEGGSAREVEGSGKGKAEVKQEKKGKGKDKMDIDTHYFDSYASNGKSAA
jgi:hypothetical protein